MNIPIRNIYYLLVYAWDKLEEATIEEAGVDGAGNATDLLAKMLESATLRLLRRGLDRGYQNREDTIAGVKGRIDIGTTLRHRLPKRGLAHCQFDELSWDVPHNQIIKSTIGVLLRTRQLNTGLREHLVGLFRRLHGITEVELTEGLFRAVQPHRRGDRLYALAMDVCRLIFDTAIPDKTDGIYLRDFVRDKKRMWRLFESFVKNFYARELEGVERVHAPRLRWVGNNGASHALKFLPRMDTDAVIEFPNRTIIVETKFWATALNGNRGAQKLNARHLYQIFAYLRNYVRRQVNANGAIEGILLYPRVAESLHVEIELHGHMVKVHAVDLTQPWRGIYAELHGLVIPPLQPSGAGVAVP